MVGADSGEIIQLAVHPCPCPQNQCAIAPAWLAFPTERRRVFVCSDVRADAARSVQGVAMKAGATKEHFDSTIGVHPTSAEVNSKIFSIAHARSGYISYPESLARFPSDGVCD